MGLGVDRPLLDQGFRPVRCQLPVFGAGVFGASRLRSRLDSVRRNEYYHVQHDDVQHDHDDELYRRLRLGML